MIINILMKIIIMARERRGEITRKTSILIKREEGERERSE